MILCLEEGLLNKAIMGLLFVALFLVNTFLVSIVYADSTLAYYDGRWGRGLFYPLGEMLTFDVPAKNLTSPASYPYVFTLNETLHVYLQIRHFLWAYNENYSNHLTIRIDNQLVLEAYSPRMKCPNGWYPGGDGVQLVYLGMISAGRHFMTMSCNISDFYIVDWWKILLASQTISRTVARPI
jgi:hypothetical protein